MGVWGGGSTTSPLQQLIPTPRHRHTTTYHHRTLSLPPIHISHLTSRYTRAAHEQHTRQHVTTNHRHAQHTHTHTHTHTHHPPTHVGVPPRSGTVSSAASAVTEGGRASTPPSSPSYPPHRPAPQQAASASPPLPVCWTRARQRPPPQAGPGLWRNGPRRGHSRLR
jgi:hypothetical protein